MFWKLTSMSASSPVESILDKENFKLEELLDEGEIIQECKALNGRLINFLRDKEQVKLLVRYIVEEPPEDAESRRTFKFPFISCEIFTCEIEVILKTLVEEEEIMDLLFSFLEPSHPHSALLAGYFSKVVTCLMLRKTVPLMDYVKAHQDVLRQLVDLIGITSIMEVLIRLVGADDHMYPNYGEVMQWLTDSNLLEMIVDKLNPSNPPEVHANASETLCVITRNASSPLAAKLSSTSFVARIFGHALEDSRSKSGLIHSLSVCISLLDPRRSAASATFFHSFRNQNIYESPIAVSSKTVGAMLLKLGDLLVLLNVSSDEVVLSTTFGELRPPLGKHRLKIVEFISVLLKTNSEDSEKELISSGTIQRVLDLFFEYPYNNALHHHVESIIISCLESKNDTIVSYLLQECDLIGKVVRTDKCPSLSGDANQQTLPAAGKKAPRVGNIGHITRISNKLVQLGSNNQCIQSYLQENCEWREWQTNVLQDRNAVENVYGWACGRPTALQDRARDSDEDDIRDRDYDVAALANDISQVFRFEMYENDAAEDHGALDRDDEDVYFDDESAEVVISSLRLGDDQRSSLFTNSNWFAFQDDRSGDAEGSTALETMHEINLNGNANGGNSCSDDEVVIGEDEELAQGKDAFSVTSISGTNGSITTSQKCGDLKLEDGERNASHDMDFQWSETLENEAMSGDKPTPKLGGRGESFDLKSCGPSTNLFLGHEGSNFYLANKAEEVKATVTCPSGGESTVPNGSLTPATLPEESVVSDGQRSGVMPLLFEEDVEFVGVELEGTEKAMEHALKEGIVGEAGPMKRNAVEKVAEQGNSSDGGSGTDFNDANYWRVDQEVAVLE